MKPGVAFCLTLIISCYFCSGQESDTTNLPAQIMSGQFQNLPDSLNIIGTKIIKKGDITLFNDQVIRFSDLSLIDDSVVFTSKEKNISSIPMSEIKGITQIKSYYGYNALIGGFVGFFGGLLIGGIVNPRRTTVEWIEDQIDGEEESFDIRKEDVPYVAIGAAAGAVIGTLVGLHMKKSTVLYFNNKSVDVFPAIGFYPGETPVFMVTLQFKIE